MNHRDVYVGFAVQHEALLSAQNELCQRFELAPRAELHVTLGFLGEVSEKALLALSRELAPLTEKGITALSIDGVGGLYKEDKALRPIIDETNVETILASPRVLWWSIGGDILYTFRAALEKALFAVGISDQFLVRPFAPHITIGSARGGEGSHKPWDVYAFEKKKTLSWSADAEAIIEKFHITKTELHPQSLYVITEPAMPRGVVVWLTGWPASGKSTIARLVRNRLLQIGRESALLDSDEVRSNLFPSLGYTDEERATFYEHLSSMAAFLARQGLIVLVPATANKRELREKARSKCHAFIEVYTTSSREESSARDPKGLYQDQKIDFVYEPPINPDIQITGTTDTEAIDHLMRLIHESTQ